MFHINLLTKELKKQRNNTSVATPKEENVAHLFSVILVPRYECDTLKLSTSFNVLFRFQDL